MQGHSLVCNLYGHIEHTPAEGGPTEGMASIACNHYKSQYYSSCPGPFFFFLKSSECKIMKEVPCLTIPLPLPFRNSLGLLLVSTYCSFLARTCDRCSQSLALADHFFGGPKAPGPRCTCYLWTPVAMPPELKQIWFLQHAKHIFSAYLMAMSQSSKSMDPGL